MINKKCFTVIRLMYIKNIYVTFYVEENWNTFTKRGIRKKHVQLCRSISCHNFQYVFNTVHVHETSLMIERKRKMTSNRSSSLSLYETNINEMSSLTSEYSVHDGDLFTIHFLISLLIFIEQIKVDFFSVNIIYVSQKIALSFVFGNMSSSINSYYQCCPRSTTFNI